MKFKKLLISFCLIFMILILSGCANVSYNRVVTKDGVILDAVCVTLDESAITSKGYNVTTVKEDIKDRMWTYLNAIITDFQLRDDGLDILEKLNVRQNMTPNVIVKDNTILAYFKFNNYTVFSYFYGLHLNDDEVEDDNIQKGFLFDKNITLGKTIFASEDARFIENEFLAYFNSDYSLSDVDYEYMFGSYENRIYSDADNIYKKDGVKYHKWYISPNKTDKEVCTYTLKLHTVNWYVVALITTGVFLAISLIILAFQKLIKRNKETI